MVVLMTNNRILINNHNLPLIWVMCFLKTNTVNHHQDDADRLSKVKQQTDGSSSEEARKTSIPNQTSSKSSQDEKDGIMEKSHLADLSKHQQLFLINGILVQNTFVISSLLKRYHQMEAIVTNLQQSIDEVKKKHMNSQNMIQAFQLNLEDPADQLIGKLFKPKEYKYSLTLNQSFETFLYKERNFDMKVKLVDSKGNEILNSNPIPVSFCIYTSDRQPQILLVNKSNQPIVKGNTQAELFHGNAAFIKMHMREVSSYYIGGTVNFVIFPKQPSFSYNVKESSLEKVVDYEQIKPLVIRDVTIRAKKKN